MYKKWCNVEEPQKMKITICYVSSYGYTKKMAEALAEGAKRCDVEVKEYDLQTADMKQAQQDISTSNGIMFGSPTILSDTLPQIYEAMTILNPVINKGMCALAFGSYAWSGEAPLNITTCFKMLKFNVPFEPIRIKLKPSEFDIEQLKNIGEQFAKKVMDK